MDHIIKVLIVDDDAILGATLVMGLQELGMEPIYQTSLVGLQSVVETSRPDIILLDVEVGDSNGIEQMRKLKLYATGIPVIFMTSHVDAGYLTQAIGEGAIAFLKKPFGIDELAAYIKRFAKMEEQHDAASNLQIGRFSLDVNTRELSWEGKNVCRLTGKQFQVLTYMLEHVGEIVSRKELKKELWTDGNESDASLDNYISQLRKLLVKDKAVMITTIPKVGFKMMVS